MSKFLILPNSCLTQQLGVLYTVSILCNSEENHEPSSNQTCNGQSPHLVRWFSHQHLYFLVGDFPWFPSLTCPDSSGPGTDCLSHVSSPEQLLLRDAGEGWWCPDHLRVQSACQRVCQGDPWWPQMDPDGRKGVLDQGRSVWCSCYPMLSHVLPLFFSLLSSHSISYHMVLQDVARWEASQMEQHRASRFGTFIHASGLQLLKDQPVELDLLSTRALSIFCLKSSMPIVVNSHA